jgi:signal transduction histidine kinase
MSHELRTPLFGLLGTLSTILEDAQDTLSSPSSTEEIGEFLQEDEDPPDEASSPPPPPPSSRRRHDSISLIAELSARPNTPPNPYTFNPLAALANGGRRKKNVAELRQMESCTRSLLSVVNNMVTYYKIDLAVAPLEMPVQLRTLLKEVCGYFESCVVDSVVFSHLVRDTVPQTVLSDATLLRHALANLVSNALRFTNDGSVTVVVDVVEPSPSPGMLLSLFASRFLILFVFFLTR